MVEKLDILAFGAHPDDVDLGCAGTILKAVKNGYKVGVIDLTQGELGTRGDKDIRLEESKKASSILGLSIRDNLFFKDGFIGNDDSCKMKIINVIRKYKPNIVLVNSSIDRHPDHGNASKLVSESCFLSGLSKIEDNYSSWRPKSLYHYIQFYNHKPDFVIDISDFIDLKMEVIKSYKSQFYNPNSTEPDTIISSKDFLQNIYNRSKDLGLVCGVKHGEGFISDKPICIDDILSII